MTVWHVFYWARVFTDGAPLGETVTGMARIESARRPSWGDCARAVPGFVTGRLVMSEPIVTR